MLYDALAAVCTHENDHQWLSDLLNLGTHKNILLLLAKVSTKKMKWFSIASIEIMGPPISGGSLSQMLPEFIEWIS